MRKKIGKHCDFYAKLYLDSKKIVILRQNEKKINVKKVNLTITGNYTQTLTYSHAQ